MKVKEKINIKESKIPEWNKVQKKLIEGKPWKNRLTNFIDEKYLDKIFTFDYDEKKKILKSTDKYPKFIHGVYSQLNLNDLKVIKSDDDVTYKLYQTEWFTGFEGKFVDHNFMFRHFISFDPNKDYLTLINKVGFFFKKNGDEDYLPYDESYVWMTKIE